MNIRATSVVAFSLAVVFAVEAKSRVKFIGAGWDLLGTTPKQVLDNVDKFRDSGLAGIELAVEKRRPDGTLLSYRTIADDLRWRKSDFAEQIPLFREITLKAWMRESVAKTWLIPTKRIAWLGTMTRPGLASPRTWAFSPTLRRRAA